MQCNVTFVDDLETFFFVRGGDCMFPIFWNPSKRWNQLRLWQWVASMCLSRPLQLVNLEVSAQHRKVHWSPYLAQPLMGEINKHHDFHDRQKIPQTGCSFFFRQIFGNHPNCLFIGFFFPADMFDTKFLGTGWKLTKKHSACHQPRQVVLDRARQYVRRARGASSFSKRRAGDSWSWFLAVLHL